MRYERTSVMVDLYGEWGSRGERGRKIGTRGGGVGKLTFSCLAQYGLFNIKNRPSDIWQLTAKSTVLASYSTIFSLNF